MSGRVISATLRLIDEFTRPMGAVANQIENSQRTFQRAGREIQKTGRKIAGIGSDLTKSVTLPITGLGIKAVKTAADFEGAMDSVASVMGKSLSPGKFGELTAKAQEMGEKMKYSASDSADAFLMLAQAGWDADKMLENIEGMMYFAGATGIELADSANYVVSAMSGLGEASGYTAQMVGNNIAVASSSSKTNADKMGEAFSMISTTVGQMGYKMEDACVILGTLANANYEGSEAGMAFNRIIERMSTNKTAVSRLQELGVAMYDEQGKARALSEVFNDLRSVYAGLGTDEEKLATAKALGGQYSTKLQAILGSEQKTWDDLTEAMSDTSGACEEMYKVANDNLTGRLTELGSKLESVAIAFGERLMPYMEKGVGHIQNLADKFGSLSDKQMDQIIHWAGIAAAVGPALLIFGKITIGVGKLFSTLGKAGKAISSLKTGFSAAKAVMQGFSFAGPAKSIGTLGKAFVTMVGPAGAAVAAIGAAIAVGVLLYKNWDKISKTAKKFGKYLQSIFQSCGFDIDAFKERIQKTKGKFGELGEKAQELWGVVSPVFSKIGEAAKTVFEFGFGAAIGAGVGYLTSFVKLAANIAGGIMQTFGGIIDFLTGVFTGNWSKAWGGIKDIFYGIFNSLVALAKQPINAVIGIINGAFSGINKLKIDVPDWVPVLGGKKFHINVPTIPMLYRGTDYWTGGPAMVHDRGAEIIDLPRGSRVYPHDKSIQMAKEEGKKSVVVKVAKIADQVIIREEADIDRLMDRFAEKLRQTAENTA